MTKKERHIVALDIGSTKTCALIGELDDDGSVKFAALGAAESKGWRKGQIVNLDLAVSSIRRAVEEAEALDRRTRGIRIDRRRRQRTCAA